MKDEELKKEYSEQFFKRILPHESIDQRRADLMNQLFENELKNQADWWLSKLTLARQSFVEEVIKEIEKVRGRSGEHCTCMTNYCACEHTGMDKAIEIIKSKV